MARARHPRRIESRTPRRRDGSGTGRKPDRDNEAVEVRSRSSSRSAIEHAKSRPIVRTEVSRTVPPRPAFDPEAARAAWRQFARNHGASSPLLNPGPRFPRVRVGVVVVLAGVAVLTWVGLQAQNQRSVPPAQPVQIRAASTAFSDEWEGPKPPVPTATAELRPLSRPSARDRDLPSTAHPIVALDPETSGSADRARARVDARIDRDPVDRMPIDPDPVDPDPVDRIPVKMPEGSNIPIAQERVERTEQPRQRTRATDADEMTPRMVTSSLPPASGANLVPVLEALEEIDAEAARAYAQLPRTAEDRQPIGRVSRSGLHVDRIGMGDTHDRGTCGGPEAVFSVRENGKAHACFRVIHPRQAETVTVLWQHDGRVVRRARVPIPSDRHSFRTRAGIRLHPEYQGQWLVRVLDDEGVELATHEFEVVR